MMLGTAAPVQAPMPKRNRRRSNLIKSLKKNFSQGLNAPFCFNILAQMTNIPARITLDELLHLSKEMRKALRMSLLTQNHF